MPRQRGAEIIRRALGRQRSFQPQRLNDQQEEEKNQNSTSQILLESVDSQIEEEKGDESIEKFQNSYENPPQSNKIKCLVVNDCKMQLTVLKTVLENLNYEVTTAQNGFQALQTITSMNYERIELKDLYQFVLMDLNMPVMNGFESCKEIHHFFSSKKQVKLQNPLSG